MRELIEHMEQLERELEHERQELRRRWLHGIIEQVAGRINYSYSTS